jgi:hypothetical protein
MLLIGTNNHFTCIQWNIIFSKLDYSLNNELNPKNEHDLPPKKNENMISSIAHSQVSGKSWASQIRGKKLPEWSQNIN